MTDFRDWVLEPALILLKELGQKMANVSAVLNEVAAGLRGPLYTSIQALIASEAAARETALALGAEDLEESTAAADVVAAFNEVSNSFAPADLPDVTPLPDPTPAPE